MYSAIADQFCWVFRPHRFLFGKPCRRYLHVKGWESLYFVDKRNEVEAVNSYTGSYFLGGAGNEFLSALLGKKSVFLLDHEQHRLARRVMAPGLSVKASEQYTNTIDKIVSEEVTRVLSAGTFTAGPWSRRLSMRVVCKVALGLDDPSRVERLLSRFEDTTGYLANIVSYMKRFWTPKGLFSVGYITAALVKRIDRELYPLIEQAKAEPPTTPESILDHLIRGQEQHGYDDEFIRDNLVALLAAGSDTTGSALSWMLFWLSRDRSMQENLVTACRCEDTAALQAFRDEVLRYCPPVEILPRRINPECWEQVEALIPGLKSVPDSVQAEPMVCPFVHRIHHDNAVWNRPDQFEPQRFRQSRRYSKHEFLPFGAGQRLCIGMNLGRLVLDRTLIALLNAECSFYTSARYRKFNPIRRNVSIWPGYRLRINIGTRG